MKSDSGSRTLQYVVQFFFTIRAQSCLTTLFVYPIFNNDYLPPVEKETKTVHHEPNFHLRLRSPPGSKSEGVRFFLVYDACMFRAVFVCLFVSVGQSVEHPVEEQLKDPSAGDITLEDVLRVSAPGDWT